MPKLLLVLFVTLLTVTTAAADVVVLSNRTRQPVQVSIAPTEGQAYGLQLASGQVVPLFSDSALHVSYLSASGVTGFRLDPNSAYYFLGSDGNVSLHKIGLGDDDKTPRGRTLPGGGVTTPAGVIDVALYVDEEEPTRRAQWERKLRDRIERASALLLSHSGMTLRVVSVGQWNTDNATTDFTKSLDEFTRETLPPPGGLAIGFTNQYQVVRGRTHLGGTRGPLSSHILLREWSQHVSENERLELLVHELGHYLGATHSPEPDSVMRPVLGDRLSRRAGFDIRFDPLNTLIMSMVGEEYRRRGVRRFETLTPGTMARLNEVYKTLSQASPHDPSVAQFAARTQTGGKTSRAELVKHIVQAVADAGGDNQAAPVAERLTGDALTGELVRRAASEAISMKDRAPAPLLLGLAIAVDDSATLRSFPATGELAREVDPPGALADRNKKLGKPTLQGRNDLMKHFFLSAGLTAATDAQQAEALGLMKEVLDANRQSGFSFADLAADRAGIRFAQGVLAGKLTPVELADRFTCDRFMPSIEGLPEGLTADQFVEQFGGPGDQRFLKLVGEIDARINALPGYNP